MDAPAIDPTLPDPVRRFLEAGATLESIVLDQEGRFTHQGQPILNQRLRRLFHRSVDRTPGGTWVLHISPYTYPITVEDTPYHVRTVTLVPPLMKDPGGGAERVILRLSDDTQEPLDPATLRYVPGRGFYCRVKGGAFEARFNSPAYYRLAELICHEEAQDDEDQEYRLRIGGQERVIPTSARVDSAAAGR